MCVPNSETVNSNVTLFNERHAQTDQTRPLLGHVNPVGGEYWFAVQGEFVLGLGETCNQGSEPGTHSSEDQLISNLLQEFWNKTSLVKTQLQGLHMVV